MRHTRSAIVAGRSAAAQRRRRSEHKYGRHVDARKAGTISRLSKTLTRLHIFGRRRQPPARDGVARSRYSRCQQDFARRTVRAFTSILIYRAITGTIAFSSARAAADGVRASATAQVCRAPHDKGRRRCSSTVPQDFSIDADIDIFSIIRCRRRGSFLKNSAFFRR